MNTRSATTALTAVSLALAAGEAIAAVVIWREAYPDSAPLVVLAFTVPFLLAAGLVRRGHVLAGALLTGALCVFELVEFPSLVRHSAFDWAFQSAFAALSLAGLVIAVAAGIAGRRSPAAPPGVIGR